MRGMVKLSTVLVCGCSPAPSPISLLRSVHVCPGNPKSVRFFSIFWEKFQRRMTCRVLGSPGSQGASLGGGSPLEFIGLKSKLADRMMMEGRLWILRASRSRWLWCRVRRHGSHHKHCTETRMDTRTCGHTALCRRASLGLPYCLLP